MTSETVTSEAHLRKFQELLRDLFQFDCADLDFGIYRIMNHKRDAVERFITTDLPARIAGDLDSGALDREARTAANLEKARENVVTALGRDALDPDGNLAGSFHGTPLGQVYLEAKAAAEYRRSRQAVEADTYNHLFAFFSRYYQDGDFISRRRYGRNQRYAIPYNGEEVYLHWANSDQYYVKTAEHFRSYDWTAPNGVSVRFRLRDADVEQNNVKGDKRFFVPLVEETAWDADARAVTILFEYRPLTVPEAGRYGARSQQDKIIAAAAADIPQQLHNATEALAALTGERRRNADGEPVTHLEHHLRQYTRRNDSDFFIHKDLRGFLSRELDFYLKNEVLDLDNLEAAGEFASGGWFQQMSLIKSVGRDIIDFLAQIEGFQKMLWEKRKFVVDTHYCVTLGNVAPDFYPEIAANEAQWEEWWELLGIDDADRSPSFLETQPTLPLDTRHFDADFTDRLLASFDDIDGITDGLLVHSENWQALRLMDEKFRGRVRCIYIDPPYNSKSTEILYKNMYKHSSWLSLLENRLTAAKPLMEDSSVLTVAIDENEQERLGYLLERSFPAHRKTCVSVVHNPGGIQGDNFSYNNEFAYFVYPAVARAIGMQQRDDNPDIRPLRDVSKGEHLRTDAANCFYPIFVRDSEVVGFGDVCDDEFHPDSANEKVDEKTIAVYPIDAQGNERKWVFNRQNVEKIKQELSVQWNRKRNIWDIIRRKTVFNYKTVWDKKLYNANSYGSKLLTNILGTEMFPFPKSVHTVSDCVQLATDQDKDAAIALDYFAGSGTTGHAVINLNREDRGERKFILVEMGEYFDTVLLPRIKKVTFSPDWKDGRPTRPATPEEAERSPRIVKYMRLESYEDALDGIGFDEDAARMNLEEQIEGYLLRYMLKWETKQSETLLNAAMLTRPFDYRLRAHANGNTREMTADVAETFAYLLGLNVRTRQVHYDDRRYLVYCGETREAPGREVAVVWRETEDWTQEDFARDRKFVKAQGFTDADTLYVNGGSVIPGAKAVEPIFQARMFAGAHP